MCTTCLQHWADPTLPTVRSLDSECSLQGPPICFPPTSPLNACHTLPPSPSANNNKPSLILHPCHAASCPGAVTQAVFEKCLPCCLYWLSPTNPLRCSSCIIFLGESLSSTEHSSSPDSVSLYTCNIYLCVSPVSTVKARDAS